MGVTHRGLLLWRADRFQILCQACNDLLDRSTPQALLLGASPGMRLRRATAFGCCPEVLTDMVEIAQKGCLRPKHLAALQADPLGSVCQDLNVAVQSPAHLPPTMSPSTPGFFPTPEPVSLDRPSPLSLPHH